MLPFLFQESQNMTFWTFNVQNLQACRFLKTEGLFVQAIVVYRQIPEREYKWSKMQFEM